MASANKSTGLQIALVFAVMSAIIALVVAFLQYRGAVETQGRYDAVSKDKTEAERKYTNVSANLDNLKAFVGYKDVPEVGKPDAEGDPSVIGQAKKLITEVAPGDLAQPTVADTLRRLGQKVENDQKLLAELTAQKLRLEERITSLQSQYQKLVDVHEKAQKDAEKDRNEAQTSKEKSVESKEKEIAERQNKIQELQAAVQEANQKLTDFTTQTKNRMDRLEQINTDLQAAQEKIAKVSYDVPSGTVQLVDRDTNSVYIDRGTADKLRKGTTFSVYKQINKGVARGSQDIKGSIEVTKLIGPHQAQARITRSINSDPIIAGDPIYTPLWKAGWKENFATVGLIDLDGDGVGDRAVLHDLVNAANGEITDEVDDQGIRTPPGGRISVGTKFLVVGRIPDFTESRPEEKEAHQKIAQQYEKMRREAQEHGVRIVSLEDFLNYIGYEPGRRVWRPGITKAWNLHQGAMGTVTRPDMTSRKESGGTTSKFYSGDRNVPRAESGGTKTPAGK